MSWITDTFELFDFEFDGEGEPQQCSYCKREVHWELTQYGWRVFNPNGTRHSCAQYLKANAARCTAEDFDVITA